MSRRNRRLRRQDAVELKLTGFGAEQVAEPAKAENLKSVKIWTDGSAWPNPGPGGWGAILKFGSVERELSGREEHTTNNRMEIQAAIEALSALKEPCSVEIVTDSRYLIDCASKWLKAWKHRGWVRGHRKKRVPVPNADLWAKLDMAMAGHVIVWTWVRGHSGDEMNERCDALAGETEGFKAAVLCAHSAEQPDGFRPELDFS